MRKFGVCLGVLTMLLAALNAMGEEKKEPNPLVKTVKSKVSDPNKPFTLVLTFQAKADMEGKLLEAFKPAMEATRKEKGCVAYELNRQPDEPTKFLMYERWKSVPDLEAHLDSAHIKTLVEKLNELLSGGLNVQVFQPVGE